ncbi:MAG: DUF2071 domain-containing protein [Acidimicrobiales bacterium]
MGFLRGTIDRQVLIAYRINVDQVRTLIPEPFEPDVLHGCAIGSVSLVSMTHIRPPYCPSVLGFRAESAAHSIAVKLPNGEHGMYVLRHDSSSSLSRLPGGRVFPGELHSSTFSVSESSAEIDIRVKSHTCTTCVAIKGNVIRDLTSDSIFESLTGATKFFTDGASNYVAAHTQSRFDGVHLNARDWIVEPIEPSVAKASYFEDGHLLPSGSVMFDSAMVMRGIEVARIELDPIHGDILPEPSH